MRRLLPLLLLALPAASEPPAGERWLTYLAKTKSGLQWRLLEAGTGRDVLFADPAGTPDNIFWTSDWSRVYYRQGATVYSHEWRLGAKSAVEAQIPADLVKDLYDIWSDSVSSRLMLSTMTQDPKAPPVDIGLAYWARIWERDPATGRWSKVVQEPTNWEAGETLGPSVLGKHIRSEVHSLRILTHEGWFPALEKQLKWLSGEQGGEGEVLLPLAGAAGRGLKLSVAWGDAPHFMAPVSYAAPGRPDQAVFAKGRCGAQQVLVPRRGDWVLVGDETSQLACPVLVDLRDGRARDLGMAVVLASWVEPPKGLDPAR